MKTESVYEETYKGYLIEIFPDYDNCGDNGPREWDNIGTIATWHRRYNLGDIQPKQYPKEYMIDLLDEVLPPSFYVPDRFDGSLQDYLGEWNKDKFATLFSKYFVSLPIYIYDHSGITISTRGFSCPWDSGQLGFIYVSKKKFMEEFNAKKWSKKLEEKAISLLQCEVQTYDDYLTGNVYGYCVWSLDNDNEKLEQVDDCWGFYPDHANHSDYSEALGQAQSWIDWKVEEDKKEQQLLDARMMNEKVGE